jgi:hypothetical protein
VSSAWLRNGFFEKLIQCDKLCVKFQVNRCNAAVGIVAKGGVPSLSQLFVDGLDAMVAADGVNNATFCGKPLPRMDFELAFEVRFTTVLADGILQMGLDGVSSEVDGSVNSFGLMQHFGVENALPRGGFVNRSACAAFGDGTLGHEQMRSS